MVLPPFLYEGGVAGSAIPPVQVLLCLECLMEAIKRCAPVVRIFPNAAGCLRRIRAPAIELKETGSRRRATSTWRRFGSR